MLFPEAAAQSVPGTGLLLSGLLLTVSEGQSPAAAPLALLPDPGSCGGRQERRLCHLPRCSTSAAGTGAFEGAWGGREQRFEDILALGLLEH